MENFCNEILDKHVVISMSNNASLEGFAQVCTTDSNFLKITEVDNNVVLVRTKDISFVRIYTPDRNLQKEAPLVYDKPLDPSREPYPVSVTAEEAAKLLDQNLRLKTDGIVAIGISRDSVSDDGEGLDAFIIVYIAQNYAQIIKHIPKDWMGYRVEVKTANMKIDMTQKPDSQTQDDSTYAIPDITSQRSRRTPKGNEFTMNMPRPEQIAGEGEIRRPKLERNT